MFYNYQVSGILAVQSNVFRSNEIIYSFQRIVSFNSFQVKIQRYQDGFITPLTFRSDKISSISLLFQCQAIK